MLLARAAQIGAGFDARVLAGMLATLDRFTDSEIPLPDGSAVAELREFYVAWRSELTAQTESARIWSSKLRGNTGGRSPTRW